jgi:hypothetical protein
MPTAAYASPAVSGVVSLLQGSAVLFSSSGRNWLLLMAFRVPMAALPILWQTGLGLPRHTDLELGKPSGTVVSYIVDEPKPVLAWLLPDASNLPRADSFSFEIWKALADIRRQRNAVHTDSGAESSKSGSLSGIRANPGGSRANASVSSNRTNDYPNFYSIPQRAN